ncbi:MAG: RagB/SusD family nutrient uptake outer membrane protein, partial [Sphingomonadales bacterium]
ATWQKIRFNRFTALALRARIAIYKSDWTTAVAAASEVINSGRYSLYSFAGIIQEFRTVGNTESILEVANNTNDNPGTDSYAYLCSQQGYGEVLGTRQSMNSRSTGTTLSTFRGLYEAYSATDVRRQFVELGNRNSLGGEVNVPLALKYVNISTYLENTKVLRFAEMYLSRAEALARQAALSGDQAALTSSLADLNLLRARRDTATGSRPLVVSLLPTPPVGQISVTAYIDTIMLERRREFALEGQRLFDLNRTRTNYVKISSGGNAVSRLIDYNATTSSFYNRTILPLPVGEVQANTNLVQNPGF